MKTILKYRLPLAHAPGLFRIPIDRHIDKVLSAGVDPSGAVCVWAVADNYPSTSDAIELYATFTGDEIPSEDEHWRFVNTVVRGDTVYHIFVWEQR